jgi:diadenosine tetraphosphate (Ap4A) HIT family hydrolase
MTAPECPFCHLAEDRIWLQTDSAFALLDNYPVSPGHTHVVPGDHVGALMELPENDLNEIWSLVVHVRKLLLEKYKPDGFNIGINEGKAAGQTVAHAHIHVIPRFNGDVPDPRGGIRWVIPDKAKYW